MSQFWGRGTFKTSAKTGLEVPMKLQKGLFGADLAKSTTSSSTVVKRPQSSQFVAETSQSCALSKKMCAKASERAFLGQVRIHFRRISCRKLLSMPICRWDECYRDSLGRSLLGRAQVPSPPRRTSLAHQLSLSRQDMSGTLQHNLAAFRLNFADVFFFPCTERTHQIS